MTTSITYGDDIFCQDIAVLVSGESSPNSPSSGSDSTKKRRRSTILDELKYLRAKRDELSTQLEQLQAITSMVPIESKWASRAATQAQAAQQALHENAQLQGLLGDQMKLLATLQRAFARRPKLCTFSGMALWKRASLGPTNWHATLDRILDDHLGKLSTEYVRRDLHTHEASRERYAHVQLEESDEASLVMHTTVCHSWPVPFTQLAELLWGMITAPMPEECGVSSTLKESFGTEMTYAHYVANNFPALFPPIQSRIAARKYVEASRVVLVWRTILEDALMPWNPQQLVGNEATWMVVSDQGDGTCRLLTYAQMRPPVLPPNATDESLSLPPGVFTECFLGHFQKGAGMFEALIQNKLAATAP
ncbi:hypothetical protein SPRG_16538 [Saprolegnia parasitica CBS 223.65]|uniref:START domain-containing protein n=1 Tax=Saprolegnia parasitica (strain CBS 223.65) TaxID=695850 RepID=A0A067BIU5_SAPPC|nr:hypothetical protein SPRG_16538 [Saprolegnia parasitica CBS 223.65]KDO18098.1 hypothetical protein SPRG_16538 [Saprolegnia parasitica CBS 223.65]|eukprot:XP_012211195.1 hypothetical protein SPRG_16538 [Saprolegnia parasitica CBS 223.65]